MDETHKSINVFYSWQSDLPKETNASAIRRCLKYAAADVESKNDNLVITLSEATTRTSGSPDIAVTLFDKISACDIFVCDVSTISDVIAVRKTPNPNVLVELGYALSNLGWDRIVMLFNKNVGGNFPGDLPFDLDRRRVSAYNIKDGKDKSGLSKLQDILVDAIDAIIDLNPAKAKDRNGLDIAVVKRKRDVKQLRQLLSTIHLETFDRFIDMAPDYIITDIFSYREAYLTCVESSTFHLYDTITENLATRLSKSWREVLSYGHCYFSSGNKMVKFGHPNGFNDRDYETLPKIQKAALEVNVDFRAFIKRIQEEFIEIDIEETSASAYASANFTVE